jgi:hypothetical protein
MVECLRSLAANYFTEEMDVNKAEIEGGVQRASAETTEMDLAVLNTVVASLLRQSSPEVRDGVLNDVGKFLEGLSPDTRRSAAESWKFLRGKTGS